MARGKGVLLAVYVERPRRRRSFSRNQQRHHHHHHHLYVHQQARQVDGNGGGGGYNRKAHLLEYSRQLRESSRSQTSSPLLHPNSASHNQSMTQIDPVRNKQKPVRKNPTCMGFKLPIVSFLRSLIRPRNNKEKKKLKTNKKSTVLTMKIIMKKFKVHKKRNFISKMFASLRKHR